MDDTVHIQADGDGPGLYFTREKVVGGLLDLLRRGHVDEAVDVYSRCTQDLAAPLREAAHDDAELMAQVANVLFRANDFRSAAEICEYLDEREKAALLFERCGEAANAARLYEALGDERKAAQMHERAGAYTKAAALYTKVGENARAGACFARADRPLDAGAQYFAADRPDLAVVHLQEIGADEEDYLAANAVLADCYFALGALDKAQAAAAWAATDACDETTAPAWCRAVEIAVARRDAANATRYLNGLKEKGLKEDDTHRWTAVVESLAGATEAKTNETNESTDDGGAIVPLLEGFAHLRALPLFKALSLRDLRRVHEISSVKECPPGTFLLLEGQPAPGMWLVLSGTVAVQREGKEIATLETGAHVGEMSLVDGGPASADVVAKDTVRALQIERAGFERLLATNDHLALGVTRVLLREMCARLRKTSAIVAGRD